MIEERIDTFFKRLNDEKNKEKYIKLNNSNTNEDNVIKFHIKRIQYYKSLSPTDKNKPLNISDVDISLKHLISYFDSNDWI